MSTRSGNIHDQSRKLSEIEQKFGRFLSSQILGGRAFRKLYASYHPCFAPRRLEKYLEDIPTSPEVIGVHTLNFKRNFTFSRLQFFGGSLVPVGMCDSKAWLISSTCKNLRAQHPLRAEILSRKVSTWVG